LQETDTQKGQFWRKESREMQSGRMKKRSHAGVTEMHNQPRAGQGTGPEIGPQTGQETGLYRDILVVGEVSKWHALGRVLPQEKSIFFLEFQDLAYDVLEEYTPSIVLSPLLCASFDCLDLAVRLDGLGFRGRYRAMSAQLPDPWLIRREIAENCPDLDFDIVDLAKATGHRLN